MSHEYFNQGLETCYGYFGDHNIPNYSKKNAFSDVLARY